MRGGFGGTAGVAIAGGAREGRLIVVGAERGGENASGGVGEVDTFDARALLLREAARAVGDDGRGLFVAREF
jgi:hypothetical protein